MIVKGRKKETMGKCHKVPIYGWGPIQAFLSRYLLLSVTQISTGLTE